jgi:hypothetical protein
MVVKLLLFTRNDYFTYRGDYMKPRNEDKIKVYQCKKDNYVNFYSKVITDYNNNLYSNGSNNKRRAYKPNKMNILDYQKRNKLIIKYRICQSKKIKILKEGNCVPNSTLELIDKFRNILNAMLEEDGIYPKDEILDVSRELDDIIYYYYKVSIGKVETL